MDHGDTTMEVDNDSPSTICERTLDSRSSWVISGGTEVVNGCCRLMPIPTWVGCYMIQCKQSLLFFYPCLYGNSPYLNIRSVFKMQAVMDESKEEEDLLMTERDFYWNRGVDDAFDWGQLAMNKKQYRNTITTSFRDVERPIIVDAQPSPNGMVALITSDGNICVKAIPRMYKDLAETYSSVEVAEQKDYFQIPNVNPEDDFFERYQHVSHTKPGCISWNRHGDRLIVGGRVPGGIFTIWKVQKEGDKIVSEYMYYLHGLSKELTDFNSNVWVTSIYWAFADYIVAGFSNGFVRLWRIVSLRLEYVGNICEPVGVPVTKLLCSDAMFAVGNKDSKKTKIFSMIACVGNGVILWPRPFTKANPDYKIISLPYEVAGATWLTKNTIAIYSGLGHIEVWKFWDRKGTASFLKIAEQGPCAPEMGISFGMTVTPNKAQLMVLSLKQEGNLVVSNFSLNKAVVEMRMLIEMAESNHISAFEVSSMSSCYPFDLYQLVLSNVDHIEGFKNWFSILVNHEAEREVNDYQKELTCLIGFMLLRLDLSDNHIVGTQLGRELDRLLRYLKENRDFLNHFLNVRYAAYIAEVLKFEQVPAGSSSFLKASILCLADVGAALHAHGYLEDPEPIKKVYRKFKTNPSDLEAVDSKTMLETYPDRGDGSDRYPPIKYTPNTFGLQTNPSTTPTYLDRDIFTLERIQSYTSYTCPVCTTTSKGRSSWDQLIKKGSVYRKYPWKCPICFVWLIENNGLY